LASFKRRVALVGKGRVPRVVRRIPGGLKKHSGENAGCSGRFGGGERGQSTGGAFYTIKRPLLVKNREYCMGD